MELELTLEDVKQFKKYVRLLSDTLTVYDDGTVRKGHRILHIKYPTEYQTILINKWLYRHFGKMAEVYFSKTYYTVFIRGSIEPNAMKLRYHRVESHAEA